jgi:DNA-directed RNA polymerase specialized sigma24 family protein
LAAVSEAFALLPARDQEALRLHDIDRLTYKAAADRLDVHPTRFNKLLARARRRLYRTTAEILRREGFDPEELPIFSHPAGAHFTVAPSI